MTNPGIGKAKAFFIWLGLTVLGTPLSGLIGWTVGGHVDGLLPALIGGALTGAGIGLAQWLWLSRYLGVSPAWVVTTSVALAVGLSAGAALVDYETTTGSLALMGAVSGLPVGIVQGLLLRSRFSLWLVWLLAMPVMWAMGWFVTDSAGVKVEEQFTVFGAAGCVVFGTLSGLLWISGRRTRVNTAS